MTHNVNTQFNIIALIFLCSVRTQWGKRWSRKRWTRKHQWWTAAADLYLQPATEATAADRTDTSYCSTGQLFTSPQQCMSVRTISHTKTLSPQKTSYSDSAICKSRMGKSRLTFSWKKKDFCSQKSCFLKNFLRTSFPRSLLSRQNPYYPVR